MLNSCYCVKSCVDTAQLLKEARRKRQAMAEQEYNEYEEGKEAKFDEVNLPIINAHGKVNDSGSLDHISPANYEFNFINITMPVPTFGSGVSNNGNRHYSRHYRSESKSNSVHSDHGVETDPPSGSSNNTFHGSLSTVDYTSSTDSSSNELEPPFRTDDYVISEEDEAATYAAFSPHQMAKKVQFTDSQHILTHSGNMSIAPHNNPRRSVPRSKTRSKSLDMDELEGSETKCCPRRKDGSLAMLTMWRQ